MLTVFDEEWRAFASGHRANLQVFGIFWLLAWMVCGAVTGAGFVIGHLELLLLGVLLSCLMVVRCFSCAGLDQEASPRPQMDVPDTMPAAGDANAHYRDLPARALGGGSRSGVDL